jgi:predicted SnoaL-like aldol condensation-catalyzing enzyme
MHFSIVALSRAFALLFSFSHAAPAVYTAEYTALGCPPTTKPIATESDQYEVMVNFISLLYGDGKVTEAFTTYVAKNLIQHAAMVPGDGRDLAIQTVGPLLAASHINVKALIVGQDRSTTFFEGKSKTGSVAAVDIFRLSGTCLVEHWVLQQPVTNSSNPHPWF